METFKNIIRNSNMSTRPEYYSGRGAILCDLNGEILQKIYLGIEKEYGIKAAKNYIKMIADIKVLSATTFLQELYLLFNNGFKYVKKKIHANGIAIPKNENGEYDEGSIMSGMISIFSAMSGNRDETQMIKGGFLHTHGIKSKEQTIWYPNGYCSIHY